MKKFFMVMLAFGIVVFTFFIVGAESFDGDEVSNDYLRIHIRANSNDQVDQNVKYKVKEKVVAFITPYITECVTKEKAMSVVGGLLDDIEDVCDGALKDEGFYYGAKAEIRQETFPTRVYGDYTLEEGVYDALIIELGEGVGDNWWCVIYPPLCFTSASCDVEYRWLIQDIINKWKKNN